MKNDELAEWNAEIEKIAESRRECLDHAIKSRGFARRVELWFARLFSRIEATGRRWRDDAMDDQ